MSKITNTKLILDLEDRLEDLKQDMGYAEHEARIEDLENRVSTLQAESKHSRPQYHKGYWNPKPVGLDWSIIDLVIELPRQEDLTFVERYDGYDMFVDQAGTRYKVRVSK